MATSRREGQSRRVPARDLLGLAAGAVPGWGFGLLVRRSGRRLELAGTGAGLVAAALIYPASRRSFGTPGVATEAWVAVAAGGLTWVAANLDPAAARRLVACGWAAHALFDMLRGPSSDSRLPAWYPAMCAGFDVALAATLTA